MPDSTHLSPEETAIAAHRFEVALRYPMLQAVIQADETGMVRDALDFAVLKHFGQERKYTFEPYVTHCIEVADSVCQLLHSGVASSSINEDVLLLHRDLVVVSALLHDVREDCGVTDEELSRAFGPTVSTWVAQLSDLQDKTLGNRKYRSSEYADHFANTVTSMFVVVIKCADIQHNASSIFEHNRPFFEVWAVEKLELIKKWWLSNNAYKLIGHVNFMWDYLEATEKMLLQMLGDNHK